jgi:hypothetical protein
MGKIAERMALKTDPLFQFAKNIAKDAVAYCQAEEEDAYYALTNTIDAALEGTAPTDTQKLLELTYKILEPRTDAGDIMDEVINGFDTLCTTIDLPFDSVGHLVSFPVVFSGKKVTWEVDTVKQGEAAIVDAMREFDLVEEEALVTFMPRLLAPLEADALNYGDTRLMVQLLSQGKHKEALDVVLASNKRNGIELKYNVTNPEKNLVSTGVLVAFVHTIDPEPFPLAQMLDAELESASDISDDDPEGAKAQTVQAFEDVRVVLEKVSEAIIKHLDIANATILLPPEDWFAGVSCARQLERKTSLMQWMQVQADLHGAGDMGALTAKVDSTTLLEDGHVTISMHRKSDLAEVASFCWYNTSREQQEESMESLAVALNESAVDALRTLGDFEPAADVAPDSTDEEDDDSFEVPSTPTTRVTLH